MIEARWDGKQGTFSQLYADSILIYYLHTAEEVQNAKSTSGQAGRQYEILKPIDRSEFAMLNFRLLRFLILKENVYALFWGVCRGEGRNELGKILMRIRESLKI